MLEFLQRISFFKRLQQSQANTSFFFQRFIEPHNSLRKTSMKNSVTFFHRNSSKIFVCGKHTFRRSGNGVIRKMSCAQFTDLADEKMFKTSCDTRKSACAFFSDAPAELKTGLLRVFFRCFCGIGKKFSAQFLKMRFDS